MKTLSLLPVVAALWFAATPVDAGMPNSFQKASFSGIIGIGGSAPDEMGKATITTTASGNYTVSVRLGSRAVTKRGSFETNGSVDTTFTIRPLPFLPGIEVRLQMQLGVGGEKITGTVTVEGDAYNFEVNRAFPYTKAEPAPQAGKFTVVFPPAGGNFPAATGVAVLTVTPTGKVTIAGRLADGAKISTGGTLSEAGLFPVFNVLYSKKGALAGFAQFANADEGSGSLAWVRLESATKGAVTPPPDGGYSGNVTINVDRYTPPATPTERVLDGLDGTAGEANFTLAGGGLMVPLQAQVSVNTANKVAVVETNPQKLKVSINEKNGLVTGTVNATIGGATSKRTFSMVVRENEGDIAGFHFGGSTVGNAAITLAP